VIDCIAFVIGVMHNPSTEEVVNIAKRKYYVWLESYKFEKLANRLKSKLKPRSEAHETTPVVNYPLRDPIPTAVLTSGYRGRTLINPQPPTPTGPGSRGQG
jgi:hypothetical protein